MIQLQLATVPGQLPSGVTILLEALPDFDSIGPGEPLGKLIDMPAPGTSIAVDVPVPEIFTLRMVLQFGADRVGVVLGPLHDGDVLGLIGGLKNAEATITTQVAFVGTVMHSQKHAKGDCGLRCDHAVRVLDECCVTCTQNSITVKACC